MSNSLRVAVWSSWLVPYALFCLFAVTSASPSEYALIARLGPATFAAVLGSTLAAAICLTRISDGRAFVRAAVIAACAHVLFVGVVAFYDADMNVHATATHVAVLVAIVALYATTLVVPFVLVSSELFARAFKPASTLPLAARHWLAVGGVGVAGWLTFVLGRMLVDGWSFGTVLLGLALIAFTGTVAVVAERAHRAELAKLRDGKRAVTTELQEHVKKILMFAESITDYFFELDKDLRLLGVSQRFTELTGFKAEEVVGQSVVEALQRSNDPESAAHLEVLLARRPYRAFRFAFTTADGRTLHLQTSALPFHDANGDFAGYRGCGADVTPIVEAQRELRRKEAELTQAQKMEAVGQLTGGLAHDFNNLLSAMVGNLELLKLRIVEDPSCVRYVDNALEAASRGAALTNRLLAFSRRQALSPRVVDVPGLLYGMEDLMRRTLGEHVAIHIRSAADLDACVVDPHQLENAVLNIAINARDAMRDGGEIVIATDNFVQGTNGANGLDAGRYVRIAITDDGEGIAPDVLPHVFEPFFTTKEPGRGSGLGLSMVYGFVQQSGGHIEVTSQLGAGTTVTMLLPGALRTPSMVHAHTEARSLLVLVEEPIAADELARTLREDGHRVHVALGVDEGSRALDAEAIDLVVLDAKLAGVFAGNTSGVPFGGAPQMVVQLPLDADELRWRVAAALAHPRPYREAQQHQHAHH